MSDVVATILQHEKARAQELAALYHERWEIETALDELKAHLRGAKIILRGTPELVRQEFLRAPGRALCGQGPDARGGAESGGKIPTGSVSSMPCG